MVKKVDKNTRHEDNFLNILYGVILEQFNQNPHLFQTNIDKGKFLHDNDYRIEILNKVVVSSQDGFHFIKSLLTTLYHSYFNNSKQLNEDYSNSDQIILKYLVAKRFLGQYNLLDHESVPLKYNLIARNYIRIKLNGLREKEILENLKRVKIDITLPNLRKVLKEIIKDGIIKRTKKGRLIYYIIDKELELSEAGNKKYNHTIRPLVEWFTQ